MSEEKTTGPGGQEQLAMDARLLSEAVIEFNISRKNVGLYPPGHIRITQAIDSAYGHISKLFEYRPNITLGITKNSLIIDNKALDSRNPVYRECARSFHDLGIAGITFQSGLEKSELIKLHEIMTRKDPPTGKAIVEAAEEAGIARLRLSPIDHSSFQFISGKTRNTSGGPGKGGGGEGHDATEDYVFGLLEGKLATGPGGGGGDVLIGLDQHKVAEAIEKAGAKASDKDESYDHVISAYLSKTDKGRLSPTAMQKMSAMMDNLTEETRQQFLGRASHHLASSASDVDKALRDMPASEIEKFTNLMNKSRSGLPDSLKNVIDKLSTLRPKEGKFAFDMDTSGGKLLHDIEMGDTLKTLFDEDHFENYVSQGYKSQLQSMLAIPVEVVMGQIKDLEKECHPDVVDSVTSEIMLEVISQPTIEQGDYLNVITSLTSQAIEFVETGRFDESLNIYNVIYSQTFGGRFEHEARSTIEYFFRSHAFSSAVAMGSRLWGRSNREGVKLLVRALGDTMIPHMLEDLIQEQSAPARKYLLQILSDVGEQILPEVLLRIEDGRWYVTRNMLMLLRLTGGPKEAERALPYVRHQDNRVMFEAMATMLRHGHKQAVAHLRALLNLKDLKRRDVGVSLAGTFKVRAVLKELTDILAKKDALGDEDMYKPSVAKALGMIGDPMAVPHIAKVLSEKTLLKKSSAHELKQAVYQSLGGYPVDTVKLLLKAGMESGDDEFRAICQRIAKAHKGGSAR